MTIYMIKRDRSASAYNLIVAAIFWPCDFQDIYLRHLILICDALVWNEYS